MIIDSAKKVDGLKKFLGANKWTEQQPTDKKFKGRQKEVKSKKVDVK